MKKTAIRAAAIILIIAAALALILVNRAGWYLTLCSGETGEVYARYRMDEGDEFAVGFIHSVHKNPLIDCYCIEDHEIYVEQTYYYSFGAGVQSQLNEGETMTFGEDGAIIVSNIHKNFETIPLQYIVGSRSDHTLILGDLKEDYDQVRDLVGVFPQEGQEDITLESGVRVVSLSALCGKSSVVSFRYEFRLF